MGYGDNRYGGDQGRGNERWQTPDRNDQWRGSEGGGRWERERGTFGNLGGDRDREQGGGSRGGNDRGFFERAGEQVRSWLGDDDDRGRGGSQNRERMSGGQDRDWNRGSESFGGGFGNQRGWSDDHFERGSGGGLFGGGRGERSGGWTGGGQDRSGASNRDEGYAQGPARSNWGGGGGGAELFGGSGFGGPDDVGRRFDRIDAGHVGAQGAHPMSSPVDAGYGGYGATGSGLGHSARSAAIMAGAQGGHHGIDPQARDRMLGRDTGQQQGRGQSGGFGGGQMGSGGHHDPHYSEWRQRQVEEFDRDYDEYRREHQSRFEQEFGGWREKRQTQRKSLGRAKEHMIVVGSDGEQIGTIDKVSGDRIILTKSDPNAGGVHHSIPCSWIESVDEKVTVNKTAQEAMRHWQSEEQNRALFERGDEGSEGPHVLNRSFSGTYDDKK